MTERFMTAKLALVLLAGMALTGCSNLQRLKEVGRAPPLSPIDNPVASKNYKPVALPMPEPYVVSHQPNSLWRQGSRAFFKDQRARRVGDILTVNIAIADSASVSNTTARSRSSSEDSDITSLLGLESKLSRLLPGTIDPTNTASLGSTSSSEGEGTIDRSESVELEVAALVTQILPNGNFVIIGRQEVRINNEVRELYISGIVRPEDITNGNMVNHSQIAEARIAYGGRGDLSDVQRPRYGQQIFELIYPF